MLSVVSLYLRKIRTSDWLQDRADALPARTTTLPGDMSDQPPLPKSD
jgi:hypothetical protein